MPDPNRDPGAEPDIRYDNWPVERRDEYAGWDVERATPREEGGTTEELADEYESELADEEIEWIGLPGGHQSGGVFLYSQPETTLYEGELDEENQRVVLREVSRHDVDEESLGEHIEEIGDKHGWEWLSSFAHEYLEDEEREQPSFDRRDSEFQQRSVGETDSYDLAFYGSHTFEDESGRIHSVERFFNVFLDDAADVVRVEVDETYLIAEEPAEERRGGDAERVAENEREIDVNVDAGKPGGENELAKRLDEWHAAHVGWSRGA